MGAEFQFGKMGSVWRPTWRLVSNTVNVLTAAELDTQEVTKCQVYFVYVLPQYLLKVGLIWRSEVGGDCIQEAEWRHGGGFSLLTNRKQSLNSSLWSFV